MKEIKLINQQSISTLEVKENYKYQRISEVDNETKIIYKLRKNKRLLENKVCSRNIINLSILIDLNNAVIRVVTTRILISKSSSPYTNPLVTVPIEPITIDIIMFYSFFSSLARSQNLSLF